MAKAVFFAGYVNLASFGAFSNVVFHLLLGYIPN
jgi:hypothetical protein